jgi:hypothetical protein
VHFGDTRGAGLQNYNHWATQKAQWHYCGSLWKRGRMAARVTQTLI